MKSKVSIILTGLLAVLLLAPAFAQAQQPTQQAVEPLDNALATQFEVNKALTDPVLGRDLTAIRSALQQGTPMVQEVVANLQRALDIATGETKVFTQMAMDEMTAITKLAQVVLTAPEQQALLAFDELKVHGGVAVSAMNLALNTLNAGPSAPGQGVPLKSEDLVVLDGYRAEVVVNGLNFLTSVAVAQDGAVYVTEAGYSYGNIVTPARVLRIAPNGGVEVIADGFNGPVAGLAVRGNTLYVSHRNVISIVDLNTRAETEIITGLPSVGDHFNENIAIGPDNKLYITQGSATNSGVVGLDNYFFGWLMEAPDFHDIPCRDVTLAGRNYTTGNPLTQDVVTDTVTTGAFLPFGTPSTPGQVVRGETKCSGAVLRSNLDGTELEVFADGFRNPYGIAFSPDGRLFVTENGPDTRGSRPVEGPDNFYEVVQGGWYGWPDFYGGVLVSDPSRKPTTMEPSQPVLQNPPTLARQPLARLPNHAAATGFDFSRSAAFGEAHMGHAFVALLGDLTPTTAGGVEQRAGRSVVGITPQGQIHPFLSSTKTLRPTDAKFNPAGNTLYVTNFGEITAVPGGVSAKPGTAALIRITRVGAQPPVQQPPSQPPSVPPVQQPPVVGMPRTGAGVDLDGSLLAATLSMAVLLIAVGGYYVARYRRLS